MPYPRFLRRVSREHGRIPRGRHHRRRPGRIRLTPRRRAADELPGPWVCTERESPRHRGRDPRRHPMCVPLAVRAENFQNVRPLHDDRVRSRGPAPLRTPARCRRATGPAAHFFDDCWQIRSVGRQPRGITSPHPHPPLPPPTIPRGRKRKSPFELKRGLGWHAPSDGGCSRG